MSRITSYFTENISKVPSGTYTINELLYYFPLYNIKTLRQNLRRYGIVSEKSSYKCMLVYMYKIK